MKRIWVLFLRKKRIWVVIKKQSTLELYFKIRETADMYSLLIMIPEETDKWSHLTVMLTASTDCTLLAVASSRKSIWRYGAVKTFFHVKKRSPRTRRLPATNPQSQISRFAFPSSHLSRGSPSPPFPFVSTSSSSPPPQNPSRRPVQSLHQRPESRPQSS